MKKNAIQSLPSPLEVRKGTKSTGAIALKQTLN